MIHIAKNILSCYITFMSKPKRPSDPNQKAKLIVDTATNKVSEVTDLEENKVSAVDL